MAHFIIPPVICLPHAVQVSPYLSKKHGLQKGSFACTLKGTPVSWEEHPAHLKHFACNLPPSWGISTTLPPLIVSLHNEHVPSAHCVFAATFPCSMACLDILT